MREPCGDSHEHERVERFAFAGIQVYGFIPELGTIEPPLYLANCACGTTLAVPFERLYHDDGGLR